MDVQTLSQNVDKSQVPPLHQKRILAFINHFIINSCTFLNGFAWKCETKFIDMERKMQKIEAALTIIEAKLASVPDVSENPTTITVNTTAAKDPDEKIHNAEGNGAAESTVVAAAPAGRTSDATEPTKDDMMNEHEPVGVRACEDVRFKKFFKMVQFGVPAEAVKMKMQADGIEPSILETPNLMLADGVAG